MKMKWIEKMIENPDYTQVQSDGRIPNWKRIKKEGKFLRVILLPDRDYVFVSNFTTTGSNFVIPVMVMNGHTLIQTYLSFCISMTHRQSLLMRH